MQRQKLDWNSVRSRMQFKRANWRYSLKDSRNYSRCAGFFLFSFWLHDLPTKGNLATEVSFYLAVFKTQAETRKGRVWLELKNYPKLRQVRTCVCTYSSINWIYVTKNVANASPSWGIRKPVNAKVNKLEYVGNWHLTVVTTKPIFKTTWNCTVLSTFPVVKWTSKQITLCFHEMVLGNPKPEEECLNQP